MVDNNSAYKVNKALINSLWSYVKPWVDFFLQKLLHILYLSKIIVVSRNEI